MDIPNDIWGQVAMESSQLYFTEDGRSRFADTVRFKEVLFLAILIVICRKLIYFASLLKKILVCFFVQI